MSKPAPRVQSAPESLNASGAKPSGPYLWDGAARAASVGMFIILLFAALYWAQPVLMPVILALVVGIVLTPVLVFAASYKIPYWLTAITLVGAIFAALSYAIVLMADPVGEWIEKAPEFGEVLKQKLVVFDRPLAALNSLRESIAGPAKEGEGITNIDLFGTFVRPMLGVLTPALGQIVVFFATLLFFLAGREGLRRRFVSFWGNRQARLDALNFLGDMERSLAGYFAVITVINLVLGILLAGVAWIVGLPNPIIWGILGFILNFLPYIGPAVTIIMLFAVGLMVFESLVQALAAPVFYLVASVIEGEFVTPSIVGMRLALSPLLVFLAVAFWTWFWGPFGALLAVPLLIIGTVAINHIYPSDAAKLPA